MFTAGVRAHYVALARCARLLIATVGSLVVTISFTIPEQEQSAFGVAYVMAKAADDRLAQAAALQLREHGVASVAVHPGLVRTEGVLQFTSHLDSPVPSPRKASAGPSWPCPTILRCSR
jgi:NAD(P)-dependent dehydrogenase (short-subunit alcohol dehydrogenase family)